MHVPFLRSYRVIFVLVAVVLALSGTRVARAQVQPGEFEQKGLPILSGPWGLVNGDKGQISIEDGALRITPAPGTNLFHRPGGGYDVVDAPLMMFAPAGDFIFAAKVSAKLGDVYDVGALVLYGDDAHWAKLCFENSPRHEATIVSVVTRERSDDVNSETVASPFVYMAIARRGNVFSMHFSRDGQQWRLVRHFEMPFGPLLRIGFAAHTSAAKQFAATFSNMTYRPIAPRNMRQLEAEEVGMH